ncbi:histidine phosphatase family protein [Gordonia sp. LSe1-13]|uniref:Histidine phosphatase family protein n=1 Tax=Gordonia sesuvii TaxID=3116777 RepID=A0ABU7M6T3_9ACTN|nr:histidine phosphatase family protein [Gordonia sp. LSe1-13]
MLIVTAGRTGPNKSVRFGGDLSLDEHGRRDAARLRDTVVEAITCGGPIVVGPERAAADTVAQLGVNARVVPALVSLDVGAWSGLTPEEIAPEDLATWFTDPTSRPHGGESVADFVARIHRWRTDSVTLPDVCVVTMPVAQALLTADAEEYFRVEIRPATSYSLPAEGTEV